MKRQGTAGWQLGLWQQRLLIGAVVALTAQVYLSVWTESFQISAAAIVYPVLLVLLMRDSHRPWTGGITALCVLLLRGTLRLCSGLTLWEALRLSLPGALFYLCYDALLCLLVADRRTATVNRLWVSLFFCDLLSNLLDFTLSGGLAAENGRPRELFYLALVALVRALAAMIILWGARCYRRLLLREEHERRYERLFLMTAELKNELYFLRKNSDDIEHIMSCAYRLYERLGEMEQVPEELSALALSIARDVHEIKKDNLRILRGIQGEVEEVYDQEEMRFTDLVKLLESSTRRMLGEHRADIRLTCRCGLDFATREHYRLLSVLKNLVTNAVEAIQSASGHGMVLVEETIEGDTLHLTVSDDGPGISERAMHNLFQMGYSTKFDPETGNINRGVGLPAVKSLVEELGGQVTVESAPGQGARFHVAFPVSALKGAEE